MKFLSPAIVATAITFLLSFGLAKGTAFVAALVLPRLVDDRTYGLLETAMTVGALGASILGFGAPGVATRSLLVEKSDDARSILLLHCAWLVAVALVAASALAVFGHDTHLIVCAAMVGLFGLQFASSAWGRMRGQIHISGWLDNIAIVAVVAVAALLHVVATPDVGSFASILTAATAIAGVVVLVALVGTTAGEAKARAANVIGLGMPMMFYGISNMLIFVSPRLAIAAALTLSDVAAFSLCARIAAILVFVSQALQIGLMRTLYTMESATFGRIMNVWIVALSGIALALTVLAYFTAHLLVAGTSISAASFMAIFPAVATQTVLWVLNSNLEMYVNRELVSRQAAILLLKIASVGLIAGVALFGLGLLNLPVLINTYSVVMMVTLVAQMRLLSRRGMSFRTSYLVLPLTCAPLLVALLPSIR
jgi:O-antigen/teichoic acid export membrane protein